MSADEVHELVCDARCEFPAEFVSNAMAALTAGGLSGDVALGLALDAEYPQIDDVRRLTARGASVDVLTRGIRKVAAALINGPSPHTMFPSYHPHPMHGNAGRDDGTMNGARCKFCLSAFKLMVDAGGQPSARTISDLANGVRKWQAFLQKPPSTNCYGTRWDRSDTQATVQALWVMQHHPAAPPSAMPPGTSAAAGSSSGSSSASSGRRCVGAAGRACTAIIPSHEPAWKIRCYTCWQRNRGR